VKLETPEIGIGFDDFEVESGKISFAYPNPSSGEVNITFSLKEKSNVELTIYNINGQKVRTIANDYFASGDHKLVWDAKTDDGRKATKGIYFYELRVNDRIEVNKIILY
jgi:flagellar hook assembly protein FlgD